jgi:predicted PurR-regulated permease PerM
METEMFATNPELKSAHGMRVLLALAAAVVLIAGMREAQQILVPFVLSAFISVTFVPPVFWLRRRGVPMAAAIVLMIVSMLAIDFLLVVLLGTSINDFSRALPDYQVRFQDLSVRFFSWMRDSGLDVPRQLLLDQFDPGAAMSLAANLAAGFGGLLTNAFLIGLTVIFMLAEASTFPGKFRSAFGDMENSIGRFGRFTDNLLRYVLIKTMMSLVTGLTVGLLLWLLGIDFPVLWGLLAFVLNYIPNIGSIIAAVPAILMALVQFGTGRAMLVGLVYLVINTLYGNIIETRLMGRGLGLSSLVVLVSLFFWGWLWGPVGMLLSVPLTMTLKIALETGEDTRWLAILLAPESLVNNGRRKTPRA